MNEIFLLQRIVDYVRLEIKCGTIKESSTVGIAYRDYADALKQQKGVAPASNKPIAEIALRLDKLLTQFDKCNITKDDFVEAVNAVIAQLRNR